VFKILQYSEMECNCATSPKEFNVDPRNIHMTRQWIHSGKRLRTCAKLFVDEENVGCAKSNLSVILTLYIIITDYPGSNFIDIFLRLYQF